MCVCVCVCVCLHGGGGGGGGGRGTKAFTVAVACTLHIQHLRISASTEMLTLNCLAVGFPL